MRTRDARTTQVRSGAAWLVGGALLLAMAGAAGAGPTPSQKCAVVKSKAAVKKLGAKMKCHQKALQMGVAVDPACLTRAETKFEAAIAKAELPGGCTVNGDAATIEAAVDFCVDALVTLTPAGGSTTSTTTSGGTTTSTTLFGICCATDFGGGFGGRCTMTASLAECTDGGGAVQPGVCRNDGTCGLASGPGDCCDVSGGRCVVGTAPPGTSFLCTAGGGTFVSNAVCTVSGCL